ncbi:ATP-binding protein [Niabella sp. CJ426]|jgi:signal transduction histidine kinase|uniref:GAF domain-containing sensor histidine kinase n=1 Tax=Niabella sp. CJ426 TaxID=3393740 RepID=UPI003CFE1EA8
MQFPPMPANEQERLKELYSYNILDTISEEDFDNITEIASQICNTKISQITLADSGRLWFKSSHGLPGSEVPRHLSFCTHAINNPEELFMVPDAREDERFADNPFVTGEPHVVFYAGVPLVTENGYALGSLCVVHDQPSQLSDSQLKSLKALSRQAMRLIELRRNKIQLEGVTNRLNEKNKALEKFVGTVAHDLRSPLNNIIGVADLLTTAYEIGPDVVELLQIVKGSSSKLKNLISDLLEQSRSDKLLHESASNVSLDELRTAIKDLFACNDKRIINFNTSLESIHINKIALEQILINLISNAIKYNDKEVAEIEIGIADNNQEYAFYVKDNSKGIDHEFMERVFNLFEAQEANDNYGDKGYGMGLAIVKELINKMGGVISLDSTVGVGTKFMFTTKKHKQPAG